MGCGASAPSAAAVSPLPSVRPPPPSEEEKEDAFAAKEKKALKALEDLVRDFEVEKNECEAAQVKAKLVCVCFRDLVERAA